MKSSNTNGLGGNKSKGFFFLLTTSSPSLPSSTFGFLGSSFVGFFTSSFFGFSALGLLSPFCVSPFGFFSYSTLAGYSTFSTYGFGFFSSD